MEQKGDKVYKDKVRQQVNEEFLRQARERFKESYFKFKPDLTATKDPKKLVEGYVDLFGEAYQNHIDFLEWLIQTQTKQHIQASRLVQMIQHEIKRRTDLRMAAAIGTGIHKGKIQQKRLAIDDIDKMEAQEFEQFLQKLFTAMGYKVELTKASGDQGADLLAEKFGSKVAVQAKLYTGACWKQSNPRSDWGYAILQL